MKKARHLYGLTGRSGAWRSSLRSTALPCRSVSAADTEALAALMHAGYLATIDDEGGSLADALTEMREFFDGKYDAPLPEAYVAIERDECTLAAALMCDWNERHQAVAGPSVAFVLVHPSVRGQGLGMHVMNTALTHLADVRWGRAFAVITEGNTPSEALFGKLGFRRIPD